MYNYLISILMFFLFAFIISGKNFIENHLNIHDISIFIIIYIMSLNISLLMMQRNISKISKKHVDTGDKKKPKKIKSKCYFAFNTNDSSRRYRKYEFKSGKVYRCDPLIRVEDLPTNAKIVKPFDSIDDVIYHSITSMTRPDGVVFNTTSNQFVYPNGFIVTLTYLVGTNWTAIDVSDYNENTDYIVLQKVGSDESGRFYVKTNFELLLVLKIIYNLKGRYYYENESRSIHFTT